MNSTRLNQPWGPEIDEQPFGNQHRAESDRDDQDRGKQTAVAHPPHPERNRHRNHNINERRRDGEAEGRADRVIEEWIREKLGVVRQPIACLWLKRQHEAVSKGIDEERHDEEHSRQSQQGHSIEIAERQAHSEWGWINDGAGRPFAHAVARE